ncbi:hypothetical protein EV182_003727 [Spiromyces aspiralis]|uniref:Uncharacterized protein n=1 Tax=Spiromyces aspiralis TaxID=68401 RepID=A0ACC1HQ04_9FUNG|nr:hypothetical protein EV182_003727 [Spiromyces aspiralis]
MFPTSHFASTATTAIANGVILAAILSAAAVAQTSTPMAKTDNLDVQRFISLYNNRVSDAWQALSPQLQNAIDQVAETRPELRGQLQSMLYQQKSYNITFISEFYGIIEQATANNEIATPTKTSESHSSSTSVINTESEEDSEDDNSSAATGLHSTQAIGGVILAIAVSIGSLNPSLF